MERLRFGCNFGKLIWIGASILLLMALLAFVNVSVIDKDRLILWDTRHNYLGPTGEKVGAPDQIHPQK